MAETTIEQMQGNAVQVKADGAVAPGLGSQSSFELMLRASKLLAASTLVPKEYQNNLPNVAVAINMAQRIGADPMMVMQNLYVVHGRPAWSAQFLIACFNQCGRFSSIKYEEVGEKGKDTEGVRAYATELSTGESLTGPEITWALVKAEKWSEKAGSKWKTMPGQMFRYRAASWFVRTVAPEIAMGLQTADEREDVIDVTPKADGTYAMDSSEVVPDKPKAPRKRKAKDEAPAETVSKMETVAPDTPEPEPMFTLKGLLDRVEIATDIEQVNEVRGLIKELADSDDQCMVGDACNDREMAIGGGG